MGQEYCIYCMTATNDGVCPKCHRDFAGYHPFPHHLQPGTVLNGKYLVGAVLGEGGFGITYVGIDLNLELKVAIKEYYPSGVVNRNNTFSNDITANVGNSMEFFEKGKKKFHDEAKMLARFCDEPNIVSVKDFFPLNNTEYIVMEYLEGIDLKEYIARNGKMTFARTFQMLAPVLSALDKVHRTNLIHRDISPSNVMILNSGRVKLLDFGAARTSNASDEKSLSVMLKPGYAPYEQYSSKGTQGPWTDVYAICATMYKMLTDITPETATDRILNDELQPICALNPSVSPAQQAVILKGMSVNPQYRYQSIAELQDACALVMNDNSSYSSDNNGHQKTDVERKNEWISTYGKESAEYNNSGYKDNDLTVIATDARNYPPVERPQPHHITQTDPLPLPNPKKKSSVGLFIAFMAVSLFAFVSVSQMIDRLIYSFSDDGKVFSVVVSIIFVAAAIVLGIKYFPTVDHNKKPNIVALVLSCLFGIIGLYGLIKSIVDAFRWNFIVVLSDLIVAVYMLFLAVVLGIFFYPRIRFFKNLAKKLK